MGNDVLLLHGFNKNARDMKPLASHLNALGFSCRSLSLPLTRHEFDRSVETLQNTLLQMTGRQNRFIHLVGHSTGGLLIRSLLAKEENASVIGRCVQIAAPNQGSRLASIAGSIYGYTDIFRTLKSLDTAYIDQLALHNAAGIDVGAIAGTKNNLLLGRLLQEENDGRVETASVFYPELADFITLPLGHKEIHHHPETARLTAQFLQTGRFAKEKSASSNDPLSELFPICKGDSHLYKFTITN